MQLYLKSNRQAADKTQYLRAFFVTLRGRKSQKIFRRTARHAGFRARSAQFSPEGAVCFYENKRFMLK